MPRPRTGSTFVRDGERWIQINTSRPGAKHKRYEKRFPREPDGSLVREIDARKAALDMQRAYDAGTWDPWRVAAPVAPGETFAAYATRWIDARRAKGLRAWKTDAGRLAHHVTPALGPLAVAAITPREIRALVADLDAKIRASKLAPKTAACVWGLVTKLFADARRSKREDLRVREDSPTADVEGPNRASAKARAYLYPSEARALLACEKVALHWRRIFALAIYTYARAGELEALCWTDVDLEHGSIHVHAGADRETGEVRGTKSGVARRVPIEPALLPLLRAMHDAVDGRGRVVPHMPSRELGASTLRASLKLAEVGRDELFASDATRKALTFHDLRATGITWCAIRGDEAIKLQRRAGHASFATTSRYIREAENVREGFGSVFPPLPGCLGLAEGLAETEPLENDSAGRFPANTSRPQRDSNSIEGLRQDAPGDVSRGCDPTPLRCDAPDGRLADGLAERSALRGRHHESSFDPLDAWVFERALEAAGPWLAAGEGVS